MSRLSKENIQKLVTHLLLKKSEKIKKEESVISSLLETWVMRRVPIEVKEVFYNGSKNFLSTSNNVQVSGYGFDYKNYSLLNSCPNNKGYYIQLVLSEEEAVELRKLQINLDKLGSEKKSLKADLTNLVFTLGTAKKVIENIPDSKEFLEKLLSVKMVPAVNTDVTSILNRLK